MRSIEEVIEEVKQKPEAMRRRYMYGCVAVAMVIVIAIWLLSVMQSFQSASEDVTAVKNQVTNTFPKTPETPSLSDIAEQGKRLQINGGSPAEQATQNYFDTEIQKKNQSSSRGDTPSDQQ